MDELADHPEQIKMEDLDELGQLIRMEFNDERKDECSERHEGVPANDPLACGISSWEGGIEVPMLHSAGIIDLKNTEIIIPCL